MSCKLYLVPEDVINSWRADQRQGLVDRPLDTATQQVDANMNAILGKDLPEYEKEKLYSQELGKYLALRGQKMPQPQPSLIPNADVLTSIPKMYKSKAKAFLDYLQSDKDIAWDEKGQLSIGQQKIDGSHIVDLLHDAMRLRRKVARPVGWEQLSAYLKQRNVPKEIVGNPSWFDIQAQNTLRQKDWSSLPATPQKPVKKKKTSHRWTSLSRQQGDVDWSTPPGSPQKAQASPSVFKQKTPAVKRLQRQSKIVGVKRIKHWTSVK